MIKRKLVSILIALLAFLLQTTVFQALKLADVVPNLLLILTVCYGYFRGRTSGLVTGLFCGLMLDMAFGSVVGLYAFILMTIGFIVGFCRKIYFTDTILLPTVLILGADLVYGVYYYVTEFLVRARVHFGFYFVHRILPEMVYTVIVGILVYRFIAMTERLLAGSREEA